MNATQPDASCVWADASDIIGPGPRIGAYILAFTTLLLELAALLLAPAPNAIRQKLGATYDALFVYPATIIGVLIMGLHNGTVQTTDLTVTMSLGIVVLTNVTMPSIQNEEEHWEPKHAADKEEAAHKRLDSWVAWGQRLLTGGGAGALIFFTIYGFVKPRSGACPSPWMRQSWLQTFTTVVMFCVMICVCIPYINTHFLKNRIPLTPLCTCAARFAFSALVVVLLEVNLWVGGTQASLADLSQGGQAISLALGAYAACRGGYSIVRCTPWEKFRQKASEWLTVSSEWSVGLAKWLGLLKERSERTEHAAPRPRNFLRFLSSRSARRTPTIVREAGETADPTTVKSPTRSAFPPELTAPVRRTGSNPATH